MIVGYSEIVGAAFSQFDDVFLVPAPMGIDLDLAEAHRKVWAEAEADAEAEAHRKENIRHPFLIL